MGRILCPRHGSQPIEFVCRHLHQVVHFDERPAAMRTWLRHIDKVEGLFEYEALLCDTCAAALRGLARSPSRIETLEELEEVMDAEGQLAPIVPACTACVSVFHAKHGPSNPM